jgi:hypothetical protein
MKTFKRILILYLACLTGLLVCAKLFWREFSILDRPLLFWLIPLVIAILAQLIGHATTVFVIKPDKKPKILNISSIVVALALMSLLASSMYGRWKHDREFGNIESNRYFLRDIQGHESFEVKLAYDSLSRLQGIPNSFRITTVSSKTLDTVINGHEETVDFITFHYRKTGHNVDFKAKFAIFQRKAYLIMVDVPLKRADYDRRDSIRNEMENVYEEALKYAPDSIRHILEK